MEAFDNSVRGTHSIKRNPSCARNNGSFSEMTNSHVDLSNHVDVSIDIDDSSSVSYDKLTPLETKASN